MDIVDGRTRNKKDIKAENRKRIAEFFQNNPQATRKDCSEALNVSYYTVVNHCKALREND